MGHQQKNNKKTIIISIIFILLGIFFYWFYTSITKPVIENVNDNSINKIPKVQYKDYYDGKG